MSQEVEMKLALGRDGPGRLCRHPLLQGQPGATQRLANTYFDTPQGELEATRMALRLRRCDDTWVQTLKTAGEGSGGLTPAFGQAALRLARRLDSTEGASP